MRTARSRAASAFAFASLLLAREALALQQPDGTPIPTNNGLQDMFTSRGEGINAFNDGQTVPETFTPSCALTFTVLQRNAGYKNSFGWYNVTGQKPADGDLHEFLACTDDVGTVKVLDIKNDPAYAGGQIAFYEATGSCATAQSHDYIFYSQKQYNPDGASYYHLIIYNSTVTPKAFYFGWEDLLSGGDNDFDDLTTFVTGITCSGGGAPCDTGKQGVCAAGTLQCQNGQLACVQSAQPAAEVCDGVDNDCNGQVDEGSTLCPADEICLKGSCQPKCGKDNCPANTVCDPSGFCIEEACAQVTCGPGTKCKGGSCVGPCDGVVCPSGLACVAGACVDPCVGLTCDKEQVCVGGACVDSCACSGCSAGQACQPDGTCIAQACTGVSCAAGQHCDPASGACVDSCSGAVCPSGEVCKAGACVEGQAGAGGSAGQGGSSGQAGSSGLAGSAGQGGSSGQGGQAGASGQGGQAGKGGAAGQAGAGGSSGKGGAAGQGGSSGNQAGGSSGQAGAAGKAGGSGQAGQAGQAGQGGKGGASGSAGAGAQGGAAGGSGKAGAAGIAGAAGKAGGAPSLSPSSGGGDGEDDGGCGCVVPGGSTRTGSGALAAIGLAIGAAWRRRRAGKRG